MFFKKKLMFQEGINTEYIYKYKKLLKKKQDHINKPNFLDFINKSKKDKFGEQHFKENK